MFNTPHLWLLRALHRRHDPAAPGIRQVRNRGAMVMQLALRILPLPLLAPCGLVVPVGVSLWLAVALYSGLIAWARGGTLVKLLEISTAVTLGSLALVTLQP